MGTRRNNGQILTNFNNICPKEAFVLEQKFLGITNLDDYEKEEYYEKHENWEKLKKKKYLDSFKPVL